MPLASRIYEALPTLVDMGDAVGPLVELRGLTPTQMREAVGVLRNVEDYEISFTGVEPNGFVRLLCSTQLQPLDRILMFWGEYGSLGAECGAAGETRIVVDFTSPFDVRRRNLAIPFDQLATMHERVALTANVLGWLRGSTANRDTTEKLKREAEILVRTRHDRPIDLGSSLIAETPVWDDRNGINHVLVFKSSSAAQVASRLTSLSAVVMMVGWRALLYGDRERTEQLLNVEPEGCHVGFGGTDIRELVLNDLATKGHGPWVAELRKSAISFTEFRALAEIASGAERISVRWANLRRWIVSDSGELSPADDETFSDDFIEVTAGRGAGRLYVSVGDTLPTRRIKGALEKRLGTKLRSSVT